MVIYPIDQLGTEVPFHREPVIQDTQIIHLVDFYSKVMLITLVI